ncbi:MAG: insecticidal delta-endotoxin Cry8Ea1 family protein [Bacteroidota bacterium]
MEKVFKYVVLAFIGLVVVFIIVVMVWFSRSNLRQAIEDLKKADSTLVHVARDLKVAQDSLLQAQQTLKAFDNTLTDIRSKVSNLENSRKQNEILFNRLSNQLNLKISDIMKELNKATQNLSEPVIHKNSK